MQTNKKSGFQNFSLFRLANDESEEPTPQPANNGNGVVPPVIVGIAFGDDSEDSHTDENRVLPASKSYDANQDENIRFEQDCADAVERTILALDYRVLRLMRRTFKAYTRRMTHWGVIYIKKS